MRRLLCWLFGHDRMTTQPAHGVCLRCGQRGKQRRLAREVAWEEVTRTATRGARV